MKKTVQFFAIYSYAPEITEILILYVYSVNNALNQRKKSQEKHGEIHN